MKLSIPITPRAGIGLALATAVISGFAIYINGFVVKQAPGALSFTTAKNLVAAAIIGAVLSATVARGQIKPSLQGLQPTQWLALAYVGFISGGLAFALFFQGLSQANPTQAAFIHKSLIIWVALLAVPVLSEKLGLGQIAAVGLLLAGQLLIVISSAPGRPGTTSALVMIFAATLIWAGEVVILRKLLRAIPVPLLGTIRMGVGALVLTFWLALSGGIGQLGQMGSVWPWVMLTGILLSGYVLTWFGALRRVQAVDVTAILVLGAFVTGLLALPSETAISALRVVGMTLIVAGVVVLIRLRVSPAKPVAA